MTQIARLSEPLEAVSNGSWLEDFEFFLVNEHTPEEFADGTVGEIALRKRGSSTVVRLRTDDDTAFLVANRLSAQWAKAEVEASGPGTYDVEIRFFRPDGVVEPRLLATLNLIEGI